jgi:rod shape-determining protein MreC
MFSKKSMVVAGALVLIGLNLLVFSLDIIRKSSLYEAAARAAVFLVAPVQEAFHSTLDFFDGAWEHYFDLVAVSYENEKLGQELARAHQQKHQYRELARANDRLRELVNLKKASPYEFLAAEVIGRDPSAWYQSIVINKGADDGLHKADPVLTANGIVGHLLHVAGDHATVMLIIDRNSAVDAMVQRTRARGLAKGAGNGRCRFDYTLRKEALRVNDIVMSSGFDGIYPKGFRIGYVSKVIRRNTGLFQEVEITPFVDFETLEEVLVLLNPPAYEFPENQ